MILTDDMLAVAFQYRETELWEILGDCDVFAFRLSDGETGYCCVMGIGGEHLALALYRGSKGFSSYLKTINMGDVAVSEIEMFEMASTLDCINCDFMQAADMNADAKKLIRAYADARGMKIRRFRGWPDFVRHQPFKMPVGITCEKDARDIVEAFRAAIAVAEELKHRSPMELGFGEAADYPAMQGGKVVPYLIPNAEGAYDWTTTVLPAFQPGEYPAPEFENDILASALRKLPASGEWQVRFIHLPVPLDGGENEDPFLPGVLLCIDVESGALFPVFSTEGEGEETDRILVALANSLRRNDGKPGTIQVGDERTESLLKDFCARCGISLSYRKELPELEDACYFMMSNFMQ